MDNLDKRILELLQKEGRLTTAEIAENINLSASPCARRIKRLEKDKIIVGYQAKVSRARVNLGMTVFVHVNLNSHQERDLEHFEQIINTVPQVINGHVVSGQYDYLLEVVCSDLIAYESFMRKIRTIPMVKDINSNFAIRTFKEQTALPIQN
ncbi:MAG: Lrp/AsnC family transcriptional regulator [Oceanospirillaceae bacterium]|nr:Lrp/AsnC family transcriptional regulator [Oceanospirillaceae bacterium]